MVSFDERLGYFLLGCFIGFVLGYIVRTLQELKEEVSEVDKAVKKNENGFTRYPIVLDIALLLVVSVTVWAAFASQKAANGLKDNQEHVEQVTICHQLFMKDTVRALNERTMFTEEQAKANVELQRYQAEFLNVLLRGDREEEAPVDTRAALRDYFDSLNQFVDTNLKTQAKIETNPYPSINELNDCLDD